MIEALFKGLTLGLLLSIAVGPILFSIIKHSINEGYRAGVAFALGVSFSDITLALLSNIFSVFFSAISSHKAAISIGGSCFLIAIGIYYAFFKKIKIKAPGDAVHKELSGRDYIPLFFSGFFMNMLNPAVFLFWLTASTTFLTHTAEERILIFGTCLALVLSADIAKALLANKIRNKLTPHNIHLMNRINGFVLIAFGFALIVRLIIQH